MQETESAKSAKREETPILNKIDSQSLNTLTLIRETKVRVKAVVNSLVGAPEIIPDQSETQESVTENHYCSRLFSNLSEMENYMIEINLALDRL